MHIKRVIINNYRILRSADISFANGTNIIVGNNDSGKSTLLEAINLALTGQIGGRSIRYQLHPWLFNREAVQAYARQVAESGVSAAAPPEILIELYLAPSPDLERLRGSNNTRQEDCPGLKMRISLDTSCATIYSDYISRENNITTLPIEYYSATWLSFANEIVNSRFLALKVQSVDPARIMFERGANRYLLEVIDNHLSKEQRVDLSLGYRKLKEDFIQKEEVRSINQELEARSSEFSQKKVSIALDSIGTRSWEDGLLPHLDDIPMPLAGKGEQAASKIWMAMHRESATNVFLVEEPENHLSFSRLNQLVDEISRETSGKQLIVTTHSNFVINKLSIEKTIMFNRGESASLSTLSEGTRQYFRKLPGHDTLRMILSKRAILVEGPSDELVVQRAYVAEYGRMPLSDGVDVISVRALAFLRFLEISSLLNTRTCVVTDNDGSLEKLREKYGDHIRRPCDTISIHFSDDEALPSLEPQIVAANPLQRMNSILGRSDSTKESLVQWASNKKTKRSLRFAFSTGMARLPFQIT